MRRKVTLVSLVLFGFVLFGMTEVFFADAPAELKQAKSNIISLIQEGNYAEAEVQTQKLLTDFSEDNDIASALWQIAKAYEEPKKYEKAFQLHQYNVEHFPSDKYAMWSQVEVIYSHIRDGNDAAADAAFDKLLTVFSAQETLPKEIYQIAMRYKKSQKPDKAFQLHQYNVDHFFGDDMYLMWSQVELVYSHIRDGNDAAADAAVDKLLTVFSQQPTLPKEIYQIAMRYNESQKPDKAFQLHQYNAEHFSNNDDVYLMWSQVEIIYYHIRNGNDATADAAVDRLLTAFSAQETLPKEVYQIAMRYNESQKPDKAFQLHQYNADYSSKNDMYTMWSQVEIIKSHLSDANDAAADAAIDEFLVAFSQQPTFPLQIYQLAMKFKEEGKEDMAFQLHQYNADHSSKDDMYTMWSQVEIVKSHLRDGNDAAADAACDKLIGVFYQQPTFPLEICQLADKYNRDDKASQLYQYAIAIENCSTEEAEIWAQAAMIRSYHALGDDAAAEAAVDKLLTNFSDNPLTARVVWELGRYYHEFEEYDKASQLYQYVIDNWSKNEYAMQAKADMAKLNIALGNEAEIEPALDSLIADFNDHPDLPEVIFAIGEQYYNEARYIRSDPNLPEAEAKDYFQKAISVWERVITELPASAAYTPRFYYITAVLYSQELGKYAKGIEYYQQTVENWPDYQYAWHAQFFIGMYYERLRNSGGISESEANPLIEQAYKAVVENYPDCTSAKNALLRLAGLNYAKGQWAEAASYFELFLEKAPDDQQRVNVLLDLGQAYEKMGELSLAAEVYRIFIETADPNDPRIEIVVAELEKLEGATK